MIVSLLYLMLVGRNDTSTRLLLAGKPGDLVAIRI